MGGGARGFPESPAGGGRVARGPQTVFVAFSLLLFHPEHDHKMYEC